MTNREFFEAIVNGTINDEIKAHAHEAIEKLDARNARRANTPSKTAIANAPIIEAIKAILTTEPQTAGMVAEKVEISVQKASALLRQIVANGDAFVTEVKVPKKGKQKGYYLGQYPQGFGGHPKSTFCFVLLTEQVFGRAGQVQAGSTRQSPKIFQKCLDKKSIIPYNSIQKGGHAYDKRQVHQNPPQERLHRSRLRQNGNSLPQQLHSNSPLQRQR